MILFGIYLLLLFRLTITLYNYVYVAWNVLSTRFCFIKFLQLGDVVFLQTQDKFLHDKLVFGLVLAWK